MLTMLMICLRLSQRFDVKLGRVNADVCSGGSTSCRVRRPETRLRAIEAFERATRKHRSSTSPSTSRLERTRTMAAGLHICGLVAGVLSWCLQSSCTSSQLWKVRSQAESLSSSHWQFEGLWMSCAATSLGTLQCNKFKTLIGLPVHVQVCRALMMSSLAVGLASVIVSALGLKCSRAGGGSERVKAQFVLSGGVMLILSGVSTLIAVSWYAGRVIRDFHNPLYPGVRFELGTGLYLGWAASGVALLGGAMLCCSYRRSSSSSSPPARYFSSSKSGQGHGANIYRAPHAASCDDGANAYV